MSTDKPICKQCGKIHVAALGGPACSGHLSSDPQTPCRKRPIAGARVCRTHGGALTKTKIAAAARLELMAAEGEIGELMRECDIPDMHPVEGLLQVVRVSGSMMRLLTIKVGELAENPEVKEVLVESGGSLSTKRVAGDDAFWGTNAQGEMVPHPYVKLLQIWSERFERACKTCLDAGIAERQVKLAEQQGEMIATAVRGILTALNLTPEQWAVAPKVIEDHLRQLSA